jgi:serine/threonine protein kinase/tetratricopeptide (TPR) repeat protein
MRSCAHEPYNWAVTRATLGHYRIDRELGEGGMGVVYAAFDQRLDRPVALKMLRAGTTDQQSRDRLWREARAAASISHPNICQIYDVGEADGELFLTMELLDGEPLSTRLARGPLSLSEACAMTLSVLAALDVLHRRGLVHRDLKPSNIFLTPHGVKLLDFGLAMPTFTSMAETGAMRLTMPGTVFGTPHYIAPEQIRGEPVDARSDIFAVGVVLTEMILGRPPFTGVTVVDVMHGVLHDQPPALTGAASLAGPIVERALAKHPDDRFESARAMADALRLLVSGHVVDVPAPPPPERAATRLIVLPFRLLRADPDVEFLAFSLADAITTSLMGLRSLVVRSSLTATRFASATLDLQALAQQANVDVALTGTLLRAGSKVRVAAQLIEVPLGTVLWSETSTAEADDIFLLQDDLAKRIVSSLELPLTAREHRLLRRDVPSSPRAYEWYLRAVQLGTLASRWPAARDLLERCVAEDPRYAPAWARLGRLYRLLAKYSDETDDAEIKRAEAALRRALELNPDLTLAHTNVAALDVELGRAPEAMARLMALTKVTPSDATLYTGLVHACRYCGLLDASVAAQHRARVLDPSTLTSVGNTYFMLGQFKRALEDSDRPIDGLRSVFYAMMGREEEALAEMAREEGLAHGTLRHFAMSMKAALLGDLAGCRQAVDAIWHSGFKDPEGFFYMSLGPARLGDVASALALLRRAVFGGFSCPVPLKQNPWLASVRMHAELDEMLDHAEARHRQAVDVYAASGGPAVLGVPARTQEV